jgi:hypothetical protein
MRKLIALGLVAFLAACADNTTEPAMQHNTEQPLLAAMAKGPMCHRDADNPGTYILISIAEPAWDTHRAHGDAGPGEDVPGMAGMRFTASCELEAVGWSGPMGTIAGWPQYFSNSLSFDDLVSVVSEIETYWLINSGGDKQGWFMGLYSTHVAHAGLHEGVTDICDVVDASLYTYDHLVTGPVSTGEFVLFHNPTTGYYAAFRVDDIYGPSDLDALADVTWYLQDDGSPHFGPC